MNALIDIGKGLASRCAGLAFCLQEMGSQIVGIAVLSNATPSLSERLPLDRLIDSRLFDIGVHFRNQIWSIQAFDFSPKRSCGLDA